MAGQIRQGVAAREARPEETDGVRPPPPPPEPPRVAAAPVDVEAETRRAEATALGASISEVA